MIWSHNRCMFSTQFFIFKGIFSLILEDATTLVKIGQLNFSIFFFQLLCIHIFYFILK